MTTKDIHTQRADAMRAVEQAIKNLNTAVDKAWALGTYTAVKNTGHEIHLGYGCYPEFPTPLYAQFSIKVLNDHQTKERK